MRDVIRFGKSVTLEELNPHNFHMKNDYMNNILFMALNVLPALEELGYTPKVEQCFLSNKYTASNPELLRERFSERYNKGLGMRVSLDPFDMVGVIVDIPRIVMSINSNVHAYVDMRRKLVEFFFEMPDESKVIEITDEEERRIA